MQSLSFKIPDELHAHLKKFCFLNKVSITQVVKQAIIDSTHYGKVALTIKSFPIRGKDTGDGYEIV